MRGRAYQHVHVLHRHGAEQYAVAEHQRSGETTPVLELDRHRPHALAYLRRLAHLGGAEALAAALPTTADAMVADGLAPRRHVGAECWALTAEADGPPGPPGDRGGRRPRCARFGGAPVSGRAEQLDLFTPAPVAQDGAGAGTAAPVPAPKPPDPPRSVLRPRVAGAAVAECRIDPRPVGCAQFRPAG